MRRGALLLSALPDLLTSHEPTHFSSVLGWARLTLFSLGHLSTGFPRPSAVGPDFIPLTCIRALG